MISIFILDDDCAVLTALDLLLSRHGFLVWKFTHSIDLLQMLHSHIPDIILLDVIIAEVRDGKSLCRELRQQYQYTKQIYLYSATPLMDNNFLQYGADGFVEKPFEMKDFVTILKNAAGL